MAHSKALLAFLSSLDKDGRKPHPTVGGHGEEEYEAWADTRLWDC